MTLAGFGLGVSALVAVTCVIQRAVAFGPLSAVTIAAYVVTTAGLFAVYWRIVQWGRIRHQAPGAALTLLLMPVPIWLALSLVPPSLSIDVYSYLGHGFQVNAGDNPYGTPVKSLAEGPYGQELARRGWLPVHGRSPYGPLWTRVEQATLMMSPDVEVQARLIKVVSGVAGLLCGYLIWTVLGLIAPSHRLLGTLLYIWNPLVLIELAGEGHNDAVMLALMLMAILFLFKAWDSRGALALGAAALVKITALLIVPALAMLAYCDRRVVMRRAVPLVTACVVSLGVGLLLYGDLWIGPATLDGLREHGRPHGAASTPGVLLLYLSQSHSPARSAQLLSVLTTVGLGAFVLWACLQVTDRSTAARAMARIALAVLLVGPTYWPWYAAVPVALLALTPTATHIQAIVFFSVCGRLAAPIDRLRLNGLMDWPTEAVVTTLIGLWVPAGLLVLQAVWRAVRTPQRSYAPVHP